MKTEQIQQPKRLLHKAIVEWCVGMGGLGIGAIELIKDNPKTGIASIILGITSLWLAEINGKKFDKSLEK